MREKLKVLDLFSGYTIREDGVITSRFGRVITPQADKAGYWRVELWTKGRAKKYLVHRLIAQTFIPNPNGLPFINHIDGDKGNNALDNLEWVTRSENQKHAYRTGLQIGHRVSMPLSAAHKAALRGSRWKNERHVYVIENETFYTASEAAKKYGVNDQTILNRCKSERWPTWSKTIERR